MLIKLTKKAQIEGIKCKSGTIHDLSNVIGQKLIDRGYAKLQDPAVKEDEDGSADS